MSIEESERPKILRPSKNPDTVTTSMLRQSIYDFAHGHVFEGHRPRFGWIGIISPRLRLSNLFGGRRQLAMDCQQAILNIRRVLQFEFR